jgi:hypothetical protein
VSPPGRSSPVYMLGVSGPSTKAPSDMLMTSTPRLTAQSNPARQRPARHALRRHHRRRQGQQAMDRCRPRGEARRRGSRNLPALGVELRPGGDPAREVGVVGIDAGIEHCAGTIAGGKASKRWIGVAPGAKLAVGLVLDGERTTGMPTRIALMIAVVYMLGVSGPSTKAPSDMLMRIGVAPGAKLAVGLVLDGERGGTDAQVLAGLDWASGCPRCRSP